MFERKVSEILVGIGRNGMNVCHVAANARENIHRNGIQDNRILPWVASITSKMMLSLCSSSLSADTELSHQIDTCW